MLGSTFVFWVGNHMFRKVTISYAVLVVHIVQHLKNASCMFIHCGLLLKDIPQWTKTKEAN